MSKTRTVSEFKFVLVWAVLIALLASVPYLFGLFITPPGYRFLGFTHNIDDAAVYLSWMRQAADGHFFIHNLFTNEPQAARTFNLLAYAMGVKAGLLHIPLGVMFHLTRIVLGIALMLMVWQFSRLFLTQPAQRKVLIPLVGLSAGIGWMIPNVTMPVSSVDMWQPEAITFLSIYLNPFFLAGLILMLASFYFLILMERTCRARYAVFAGLCLLLLGNVHTYDVLTVGAIWLAYVLGRGYVEQTISKRIAALTGLAAVVAAPAIAYQVWLYFIDPVFRARTNTMTESPPLWSFLAGYGLLVVGAIAAAVLSTRRPAIDETVDSDATKTEVFWSRLAANPLLFPMIWVIIGFALPYAPVAQQRKLAMGLHLPLCILSAYVLPTLIDRIPASMRKLALMALMIVLIGSNIRFMGEDLTLLAQLKTPPKYLPVISTPELAAMDYLRKHAGPRDAILAPPSFALFVPAIAGRQVYYGHWSETPDYVHKIRSWFAFETKPQSREKLIRKSKATYVVVEGESDYLEGTDVSQNLTKVFESGDDIGVYVYKVRRPQQEAEHTTVHPE